MNISISQATLQDVDDIFRLSCAVHHQPPYTTLIPPEHLERFLAAFSEGSTFEPKFKAKLIRFITAEDHHVYVARDGSRIVGYRMAERRGDDVFLHGLFVDDAYRGRGIGRALFTAPLTLVPKGGSAHLTVLADNVVARTLYESRGFRVITSPRTSFYGAPQLDMVWQNA